jgi:hypothetical protein
MMSGSVYERDPDDITDNCDLGLSDDTGSESSIDVILDTSWINTIENNILYDEYSQFIKTDTTSLTITFLYINKNKEIVDNVKHNYNLAIPNQITQDEILNIMQKYQMRVTYNERKKKVFTYYNFYSLLHYSFQVQEDVKSVASYLASLSDDLDHSDFKEYSNLKEYSNIISLQTLFFTPTLNLFHGIASITILLHED